MRLFGWFRRSSQEEVSAGFRRWFWLGGRRMLANTSYILPKDELESDRLNLQHHLVKLAARGNYRAPIRQPRAVLDVACGTGIWAREMAQEFPKARVVGFDIDLAPLERHFVLGTGDQAKRQQRLLGADVCAGHKHLQAILVRSGYFSDEEYSRLLEQEQQEVAEMGMTMKVIFAFGTKL